MPKNVQPTTIMREKIAIPSNLNFPPGIYTRHPPTKCAQSLQNRPIHLKKSSAYDGKEIIKIVEPNGVRDCLVPSKEAPADPKIISKKEYEYFQQRAQGLSSKEEQYAAMELAEKERERLMRESMERREAIRRMDMKKGPKDSRLSEAEAEARKRTMHLLERAYNMKLEEAEEIQRCNRLILETKCRTIRDAQIAEKKLMERELASEEKRLNDMMENERRWAVKQQEKKEEEETVKRQQFARILRDQIEMNEAQRILEFERKQEESRLINLSNIAWQQEEMAKVQNKEAEIARIRSELAESNEQLKRFKDMELEESRIIDMRIKEFQRQKEERDAQMTEEQRLMNLRKEREKQKVAARSQQAKSMQAHVDELNTARIQEVVEREWREREKMEALKRAEEQKMLMIERDRQINNKRMLQATEMEREKREFERILSVQKEAFCRDMREQEEKKQKALAHRSEILKQVNEKERERILARQKMFEEGQAIRTEAEMRKAKLREAMERKCEEMEKNKVPKVYIDEVKRMIENTV